MRMLHKRAPVWSQSHDTCRQGQHHTPQVKVHKAQHTRHAHGTSSASTCISIQASTAAGSSHKLLIQGCHSLNTYIQVRCRLPGSNAAQLRGLILGLALLQGERLGIVVRSACDAVAEGALLQAVSVSSFCWNSACNAMRSWTRIRLPTGTGHCRPQMQQSWCANNDY